MDDLISKYLKTNKVLVKPKQPNLGEMNRTTDTVTSRLPKPLQVVPKSSNLEPEKTQEKYVDTLKPGVPSDNIYTMGVGGSTSPKDTRVTTYVNNNYAGDDYVD